MALEKRLIIRFFPSYYYCPGAQFDQEVGNQARRDDPDSS